MGLVESATLPDVALDVLDELDDEELDDDVLFDAQRLALVVNRVCIDDELDVDALDAGVVFDA